jgi:hypothetical protein
LLIERALLFKTSRVSFGGTAAIVSSMAFMVGLDAAHASRAAIISALLIAGFADNMTDSLSVHFYQESERLDGHEAFIGTLSNFATRLAVCLVFVLLVAAFPIRIAIAAALVFGTFLLGTLTYTIARQRQVEAVPEVAKHLAVAFAVILASRAIGYGIGTQIVS